MRLIRLSRSGSTSRLDRTRISLALLFLACTGVFLLAGCSGPTTLMRADEPTSMISGDRDSAPVDCKITDVRVKESNSDSTTLVISGEAPITFNAFKLQDPMRITFDIPGFDVSEASARNLPYNEGRIIAVRHYRINRFDQGTLRLEIFVDGDFNFETHSKGNDLFVSLSALTDEPLIPAPVAVNETAAEPVSQLEPETALVVEPDEKDLDRLLAEFEAADGKTPDAGANESAGRYNSVEDMAGDQAQRWRQNLGEQTSDKRTDPAEEAAVGEDEEDVADEGSAEETKEIEIGLAPGISAGSPFDEAPPTTTEILCKNLKDPKWKGELVTYDIKRADIVDLFRGIAKISGFNVVIDPGVSGKISLRLSNVPWNQAMQIILKNSNLSWECEGNVIRVATMEKLRTEAEQKERLREARKRALPLERELIFLNNANAGEIQALIKDLLSPRGNVLSDPRTNAIIITDMRHRIDSLKRQIESWLDTPIKQVSINTKIVQATKDFSRNLGIGWRTQFYRDAEHGNPLGFKFPYNFGASGSTGLEVSTVDPPPGPGMFTFNMGDVMDTVLLELSLAISEAESTSKTISSTKVITKDNRAATISSGVQIPYIASSEGGSNITFQSATTSLNVTPHITNDNFVEMIVSISKNSPGPAVPVGSGTALQIYTNSAKTQVTVKDGDTFVLGNLNTSTMTLGESGMPWMRKIPVLGWLFKNRNRSSGFTDLLIFITPSVLESEVGTRKSLEIGGVAPKKGGR